MGEIIISFSYTHGSVDAKHAEKHDEKMKASQEVTGDSKIDNIFDEAFIAKVTSSSPHTTAPRVRQAKQVREEEEQESTSGEEFSRLSN